MVNEETLNKVIANSLAKLEDMEPGSEGYKELVDTVAKLQDKAIEMERVNIDAKDKAAAQERAIKNDMLEHNLKCEQMNDEHKDRLVKNVLNALGIVLPIGLTIWGTKASFKFEEEGTITTIMGRGFINRLFGKK